MVQNRKKNTDSATNICFYLKIIFTFRVLGVESPRGGAIGGLALFSARFDGGPVELKLREVHRTLRQRGLNVLMVEAERRDNV